MLNSFENDDAYDETEYLLSSRVNKAHLIESIAQAQHGELISFDEILETVNEVSKARGYQ